MEYSGRDKAPRSLVVKGLGLAHTGRAAAQSFLREKGSGARSAGTSHFDTLHAVWIHKVTGRLSTMV